MKKHLLATTAAITMVGGAASAQDWNLEWGGYFNADVLYNSTSGNSIPAAADVDGINIHQNSEINFTPSVTLDNGMTFGVVVELETENQRTYTAARAGVNQTSSYIDESYMFISSDTMGRVEVGSENSAGYKLSVGAPSVGFGINSPSPSAYHPAAFLPRSGTFAFNRNAMASSSTEVAGNNDTGRISYFTPSFNGLTLGVSYAPGNTNVVSSGLVDRNAGLSDIFDIGANYSQSFGNVDMTLSARWGTGDAGTVFANIAPGLDGVVGTSDDILTPAVIQPGDPETWAVGAQFSTAGFTFGGSYAENTTGAQFGVGDTEGFSLGVTYDMAGPWRVGFDTYQGERQGVLFANGTREKSEYVAYQLGAERSLGNGVAWRIYAIQSETSSATPGTIKQTTESTTVGTGIRLTF